MKTVFVFLAVSACVMMAYGQGIPTAKCPTGEHSVQYCPQMAEPSCDNPKVHDLGRPTSCGIPQCFCNTPTIRNTKTGKCVKPADCQIKC